LPSILFSGRSNDIYRGGEKDIWPAGLSAAMLFRRRPAVLYPARCGQLEV